jgi:hypothetical protein
MSPHRLAKRASRQPAAKRSMPATDELTDDECNTEASMEIVA